MVSRLGGRGLLRAALGASLGAARGAAARPRLRLRASTAASATGAARAPATSRWAATAMLVVALASGALAAPVGEAGRAEAAGGPFEWPELAAARQLREEREKQLRELRAKARNRVFLLEQRLRRKDIDQVEFGLELHKLKAQLNVEAQKLLFGVSATEADLREQYLRSFGCCKWSEAAMAALVALSPLVELGAGNGQWAAELARRGADVLAFDDGSMPPIPPQRAPDMAAQARVQAGDERVAAQHSDRTLLLVCPPPTDMPLRCVRQYKGARLAYVGEGRGGAHGDAAFFDELERKWRVTAVIQVEPFKECHEKLFLLERRAQGWGGYLLSFVY
jgi:hypothetical protein